MQQLKNINKTDKHYWHTHTKKRYLEAIGRSTRFKEFNREKKTATKTSNMFKIVPRIGTCDAGFSSSKFHSSCLPFVVKQTTLPVFS
jgi:Uri superfamily endonuclease